MSRKGNKKILVVCPTIWDIDELRLIQEKGAYGFIFWPFAQLNKTRPGFFWLFLTHLKLLSINRFIDKTAEHFGSLSLDGVISTDDHMGCAATAGIAERLDLPSPPPKGILTCQHKLYSRLVQLKAIPDATPKFWTIGRANPNDEVPAHPFPFYAKPVRGTFSILSKKICSQSELRDLVRLSLADRLLWHLRLHPFNELLKRYTDFSQNGDSFLGEELLEGHHASLEGYCYLGKTYVLGILDSHMYSGTNSFKRFDYPSRLNDAVKARMCDIALTLMPALEFDNGLFEIEVFYDPQLDRITIIEVNPRMCAQFADLFEKVDGTNAYDIQLAIATGQEPPPFIKNNGNFGVASSFVLRVFDIAKVVSFPKDEDIEMARTLFPDIRIRLFCKQGEVLTRRFRQLQDMSSTRIAAINVGGNDFNDLISRFRAAMDVLPIELSPSSDFHELSD